MAPSMTFLIYMSPLAYYNLLQISKKQSTSTESAKKLFDSYSKLDIPLPALKVYCADRQLRTSALSFAKLSLVPSPTLSATTQTRIVEQPSYLGRPFFRLPGISLLVALEDSYARPPEPNALDDQIRDAWVLDFTDRGRLPGIVMNYARKYEILKVPEPGSAMAGNIGLSMHVPPISDSWLNSLVSFCLSKFSQ